MASPHHVLILGGHGKIAQLLTPLLLKRSWTVTSVIRKQEQVPAVEKLGAGLPGRLSVLVRSIEDVDSQEKAASILDEVNPDYVAWSAGMRIDSNFLFAFQPYYLHFCQVPVVNTVLKARTASTATPQSTSSTPPQPNHPSAASSSFPTTAPVAKQLPGGPPANGKTITRTSTLAYWPPITKPRSPPTKSYTKFLSRAQPW